MTATIAIQAVSHDFGTFRALDDINLEIEAGEYIVLLGPSGCGKTTLLSTLGGFIDPTRGTVLIGGRDMTHVPPAKRPTTTMFQDYALFPHMTLRDNVGFGPRMAGVGKAQRDAKALELLDLVGLKDAASKRPYALSGGQRQRVALARSLAVDPDVLLLDEPLGALDLKLRRAMQDELKQIQRKVGTTFVHVTHDQEEAMAIADRIVVMNGGRIEDCGPPDRIYRRPGSLFAAGFMGEMNRIPGTRNAGKIETAIGALPAPDGAPLGPVTLCLRPEQIGMGKGAWDIGAARITDAAFFGTHFRCHLAPEAAPDMDLIAHLPPNARPDTGSIVQLSADPADLSVFEAEA
ncbi:spermidine/putrescine transport system ATP-binding protein [Roseovarius nanhaiticus]|uniref:Spermidine/putrescine transport system ATP-binding protein n=1 Tax=Roseovarius nanhaiticus TaxID=573024 RepID=A0A1N7HGA0_9RHOB|nr:spermidine/putrescine transport system ATP-binding protein [Roseovarius nanhaiticus]SIS23822.1 spermidine/putrescine transport system ATP-binding protein [Roseovarius nanhaiticus]